MFKHQTGFAFASVIGIRLNFSIGPKRNCNCFLLRVSHLQLKGRVRVKFFVRIMLRRLGGWESFDGRPHFDLLLTDEFSRVSGCVQLVFHEADILRSSLRRHTPITLNLSPLFQELSIKYGVLTLFVLEVRACWCQVFILLDSGMSIHLAFCLNYSFIFSRDLAS